MSSLFQFKQFSIRQDKTAMQIGTDAVLLGAWVDLDKNPQNILDIGAGTGVIALQLAQRSNAATIDAVEIDSDAHEQCTENFEASPWADRLFCYHASIQEFASSFVEDSKDEAEAYEKYDLIVSNPPFYSEDYKTKNASRDLARFTDALPFQHLIVCVAHLLSEHGTFSAVIPKKEEKTFIRLASENQLVLNRICSVRGTATSEEKRSMLTFSFQSTPLKEETLTIELERHVYTEAYKNLVQDFYLKM